MNDIHSKIEQERDEARNVCEVKGDGSVECAVAWDAVEELQAEAAHQRQKEAPKNSLQQYCDANPEADECRIYDN
ncbi:MAG: Calvin cycle protein CP12 [Oculatellaceae cyanobacterium bins.114]|nr:Calvin cycle protein CP12 [Oculatellaceae cyanobacterium bins.114]